MNISKIEFQVLKNMGMRCLVISGLVICILISNLHSIDIRMPPLERIGEAIAHGQRITIGIAKFTPGRANIKEAEFARKIQQVLKHDLLFTRYFNITESDRAFKGRKADFKYWRSKTAADVLLTATIKISGKGCRVKTKLYDVPTGETIFNKRFINTQEKYRSIAHLLNDEIVLMFTGERGIAHTKIVFSNNSTRYKEIYVVDYDGYNLKRLTNDRSINILPRWSSDGKKIIYTTYKYGNPDLYIMNRNGSNKKGLSTRQGLNTPAVCSPDGKYVAVSLSRGKLPNIYLLNLKGKIVRKITHGYSMNTSPCFSPDSKQLVFVSGRAGYPQMYITDIHGTNTRRLSTEGYSDSPSWSPKGDLIAFSLRPRGASFFDIHIYDVSQEMYYFQLTQDSGSNEHPSFSPDGRHIVFTSNRNGKYELFIMFVDGSGQRRIGEIKGNSFTPNWSP